MSDQRFAVWNLSSYGTAGTPAAEWKLWYRGWFIQIT
jgi:hypothetical protein